MNMSRFCRPVSGFRHTLKYPVVIFFHIILKSYQSTLHKGEFSSTVSDCYCFAKVIQIQAYRPASFDILHTFGDSCAATKSTQDLYILPALVSVHYNVKRKSVLLRSAVMVSTDNTSAYQIL